MKGDTTRYHAMPDLEKLFEKAEKRKLTVGLGVDSTKHDQPSSAKHFRLMVRDGKTTVASEHSTQVSPQSKLERMARDLYDQI